MLLATLKLSKMSAYPIVIYGKSITGEGDELSGISQDNLKTSGVIATFDSIFLRNLRLTKSGKTLKQNLSLILEF